MRGHPRHEGTSKCCRRFHGVGGCPLKSDLCSAAVRSLMPSAPLRSPNAVMKLRFTSWPPVVFAMTSETS